MSSSREKDDFQRGQDADDQGDTEEVVEWYLKSAQGVEKAIESRDSLETSMTKEQICKGHARTREWQLKHNLR